MLTRESGYRRTMTACFLGYIVRRRSVRLRRCFMRVSRRNIRYRLAAFR